MRILSVLAKVLLVVVLLPLVAGCCAEQDKRIQQLVIMNREQGKTIIEKDAEIARLTERIGWLDQSARGLKEDVAARLAGIAKLEEEIAALKAELARREAAYIDLANKCAGKALGGPLPGPFIIKLKALQDAYPGLFTFDEATGMLQFASDVTFDSGSDTVKAAAQDALTKLAAILQDEVAQKIVASVIGHTDNARVVKPETVARFGNNQRLSEARAEAVKAVLTRAGVADARVVTKGMGESQPIADNKTPAGMAKNRRVEIFLKMGS